MAMEDEMEQGTEEQEKPDPRLRRTIRRGCHPKDNSEDKQAQQQHASHIGCGMMGWRFE